MLLLRACVICAHMGDFPKSGHISLFTPPPQISYIIAVSSASILMLAFTALQTSLASQKQW